MSSSNAKPNNFFENLRKKFENQQTQKSIHNGVTYVTHRYSDIEEKIQDDRLVGNKREREEKEEVIETQILLSEETKKTIEKILMQKNPLITIKIPSKSLDRLDQNMSMSSVSSMSQSFCSTSTAKNDIVITKETLDKITQIKMEKRRKAEEENSNEKNISIHAGNNSFFYSDFDQFSKRPSRYDILCSIYNSLDYSINLNKVMKSYEKNTFYNLKTMIETATKHTFNLSTFQRILYLVPNHFIVKWIKNKENKEEFDLRIDMPNQNELYELYHPNNFNEMNRFESSHLPASSEQLEMRRENFKKSLEGFIKKQEAEKGVCYAELNILGKNKFLKELPKFPIPKPSNENYNLYQACIKYNDIKAVLTEEGNPEATLKTLSLNPMSFKNPLSQRKEKVLAKYVSQEYLDKLSKKQMICCLSKKLIQQSHDEHYEKDKKKALIEVVKQIKNNFVIRPEPFKISDLINNVLNSSKYIRSFFDQESLRNFIENLCRKFPFWIKIKNHVDYGPIVVLANEIDITNDIIPRI